MIKALNLDGPRYDEPARKFAADTGTRAVVLWQPAWSRVQPQENGPFTKDPIVTQADEQYAQARKDGLRVLMAGAGIPEWPCQRRIKLAGGRMGVSPDDLTTSGPWAKYLEWVYRRYPDALHAPLNEPNFAYIDDPQRWARMAKAVKTAAAVAAKCGLKSILAPAMLDTSPRSDTEAFLRALNWPWGRKRGWQPPAGVRVAFAHHAYCDVNDRSGRIDGVLEVLRLLREYKWAAGQRVWLTEQGYNYGKIHRPGWDYFANPAFWDYTDRTGDEQRQIAQVASHYELCKQDGRVMLWANYELPDSMWSGWATGMIARDGTPHPLAEHWAGL